MDSRAGQVVGNIVSAWIQMLGLVLMTKYARERGSKEGQCPPDRASRLRAGLMDRPGHMGYAKPTLSPVFRVD